MGVLKALFGAAALPKTKLQSLLLAAGLTMIPGMLLLFQNMDQILNPWPVLKVVFGAGLVTATLTAIFSKNRAPHVAAGTIGAIGYGFFSLSWLPEATPLTLLGAWLVTSVIGAVFVVWLLSNSRLVLNIATFAVMAISLGLAGVVLLSPDPTAAIDASTPQPSSLAFTDLPNERPNIYLFILDGFTNPDITTEQFAEHDIDFDISASMNELEALGFERDVEGSSNYRATILSVPSTLNSQYHHSPDSPLTVEEVWADGQTALGGNNNLVNALKGIGYEYWHASSVLWAASSCNVDIADVCLGDSNADFEAWSSIWSLTPLRQRFIAPNADRNPTPISVVNDIIESKQLRLTDEPTFTFSHILNPHPPFQFDVGCNRRGARSSGNSLTAEYLPEFRTLYVDQVTCLGTQLEEAMAKLIEADPTAMIFLQADHGTAFEADTSVDNGDWAPEFIRERFSIFKSSRIPDACRSDDPAAQSSINTSRIIMSCLDGSEPDFLQPRILLTDVQQQFNDVPEADVGLISPN